MPQAYSCSNVHAIVLGQLAKGAVMPFLAQGLDLGWHLKDEVRLIQKVKPGRFGKVNFRFDEPFAYSSLEHRDVYDRFAYIFDQEIVNRAARDAVRPGGGEEPEQWPSLRTDLATIPSFLWGVFPNYGRCTLAAIMHDSLCDLAASEQKSGPEQPPNVAVAARQRARFLRRHGDQLFRLALADSGVGLCRRWIMWSAVRLGGSIPVLILTSLLAILATLLFVDTSPIGQEFTSRPLDQGIWTVLVIFGWLFIALAGVLDFPWWSFAAIPAMSIALLIVVAVRSSEEPPFGQAMKLSKAGAFGSMLGAIAIALVATPFLLSVTLVTLATLMVVYGGDIIGWVATGCGRGFEKRRRLTIWPVANVREGRPAAGDSPKFVLENGMVRLVDKSRLLATVGNEVARATIEEPWALGVLISRDAPQEVQARYADWIGRAARQWLDEGAGRTANSPAEPES